MVGMVTLCTDPEEELVDVYPLFSVISNICMDCMVGSRKLGTVPQLCTVLGRASKWAVRLRDNQHITRKRGELLILFRGNQTCSTVT